MIIDITNNTCFATWQEGVTTSWQEVADEIQAHWLFGIFQWISIFGIVFYVGDQDNFNNFYEILSQEWMAP